MLQNGRGWAIKFHPCKKKVGTEKVLAMLNGEGHDKF